MKVSFQRTKIEDFYTSHYLGVFLFCEFKTIHLENKHLKAMT